MDGIIILNKPAGMSSARAVGRVKSLLPRGTKIGHAGTLDPFATGVLLLLIGKATKRCESLMDQPKQYDATVRFGATTATDDPESPAVAWSPAQTSLRSMLTAQDIHTIFAKFTGQIQQVPPTFSALKVNGRRAYQLARAGIAPVMVARTVTVYSLQMIDYCWPDLKLRVDCGRGTYIRSLAREIGAALDVGGYLRDLVRTRIGRFELAAAASLEDLTTESLQAFLIPLDEI